MKTYQALSFKVIYYNEDVIRTSGVEHFNTKWFSDASDDSFEEGVE